MKALALLVICSIVLSGCSDKKKDDDPDPTTSSSSSSPSGAPGSGSIAASLGRTTPNGAVPLQVNLTIDADFKAANGTTLKAAPAGASWTLTIEALGNATGNATGLDGVPGNATPG